MEENQSKDHASFKINLKEGIVELAGSQEFVEKYINKFRSEDFVSNYKQFIVQQQSANIPASANGKNRFENVLYIDEANGKVSILTSFDQQPKKSAMIQIALIYLWAKRQLGIETVDSREVRDICQDHAVLDEANFAKHLGKEKIFFVIEKSTKGFTMKLTVPGIRESEKLLESLNGDGKHSDSFVAPVQVVDVEDGVMNEASEQTGEFQSFGEMLNVMNLTKDTDRFLAAGYFLQSKSPSEDFTTIEVNNLLKDFGHSLSNVSVYSNLNVDNKRTFKTEGKKYRVSASGEAFLKSLLNK